MSELPIVYLARHGETAWTVSGQHTSRTDLPLIERGERNACGSRWLGLNVAAAQYFLLSTASLSTLTYEHNLTEPAIGFWNDATHVVK